MNVLALDTATTACSVALRRADGELFELRPPAARLGEAPAHTTELLPAVLELAERAATSLTELDRVVVGVGPGAFTGLRIGIATARALAGGAEAELVPVSSLAALSAGWFTPVIDARRSEFFFRVEETDRLAGPEEAVAVVAASGRTAVGDGAIKLRDELTAAGVELPPDDDQLHVISAATLIALADEAAPQPLETVVPNYIRPPDAKVSSRESWLVGSA